MNNRVYKMHSIGRIWRS